MKHETITELEALQNAVNHYNLTDFKIHEKRFEDKRKTAKMYFLHNHKTGETISPVLDYDNLNHFIFGYGKALNTAPVTPVNEGQQQPAPILEDKYFEDMLEAHVTSPAPIDEKFTGGEWEFEQCRGNNRYEHHVFSRNGGKYGSYVIAQLGMQKEEKEPEEIKANARLIAEAKNMYELIKRFSETAEFLNGKMPAALSQERKDAKAILNRIK